MSLIDVQKDVDDWVSQFTPPYWPPLEQFAHLVEETGEVARLLNHLYGVKKKKPEEAQQQLGSELTDILFTLICLANSHNINLQAEWDKMIDEKCYHRDANRFQKKEQNNSQDTKQPQQNKQLEERIAVKAFIINPGGKLLVMKRAPTHKVMPNLWEIVGGRLNPGEDTFEGLKREVKEECGLQIEILNPLAVRHFSRSDGQLITFISFLCKTDSSDVILSGEHTEFKWIDLSMPESELAFYLGEGYYLEEFKLYKKLSNS